MTNTPTPATLAARRRAQHPPEPEERPEPADTMFDSLQRLAARWRHPEHTRSSAGCGPRVSLRPGTAGEARGQRVGDGVDPSSAPNPTEDGSCIEGGS